MSMRRLLAALALAIATLPPLAAQEAQLPGYSPGSSGRERALERLLGTLGDTARARHHSQQLSAVPHVAGTLAQQTTARYVLEQMRGFGLDTTRTDFQVYIPYPESTVVEIVSPTPMRLALEEPALAEDEATQGPIWPAMNGHAGSGEATAPVVYVNYGLPEDYRVLDSLGVSVRGRIAIARYGRSFRGIKAHEAESRGALALLLYSDPAEDGYLSGDVYPEGPMRPLMAVQRGSVYNGIGDPSTPGVASAPGVQRLPPEEMNLPRIPVVPLGYGNAALLLEPLRGRAVPQAWQGGLPFRYHVGESEVVVHVGLWHEPADSSLKKITDTFGSLRGSEWPEQVVLVGGHRDAWGPGAMDNVSGVVSILEAARMVAEAAKRGYRPRRTIVFATWDAEEWGMMGSTEWVEGREAELAATAVAYLNLDVSVSGREFGASGTASLHPLIRELAQVVAQPYDSVSIYSRWRARTHPADTADVRLGDLGGGSDFAGFYNHLGIPAAGFGFGGPAGIYHSAYDSFDWMRRFGDSTFQAHTTAGELAALFLCRLANADLEPFDYSAFTVRLKEVVRTLESSPLSPSVNLDLTSIRSALDDFAQSAAAWQLRRDAATVRTIPHPVLTRANAALRRVERQLTRPEGLEGRPWMRNLIFASDRENGYATVAFPGVVEALRAEEQERVHAEVEDLARRLRAAAETVDSATRALP